MDHSQHATHAVNSVTLSARNLYCACCADELEKGLRANPHIVDASVDFLSNAVTVKYHAAMIDEGSITDLINGSRRCNCGPEEEAAGETAHMHHQAQMAPISMGTKQDRMQYELPASGAHADHEQRHQEASAHAGMDHDMSDPKMAKAMETDMRNRFFVALALTIPTILYSPVGYDFLGIDVPDAGINPNWIALVTSTPVVWWAGWIFIGGSYHSLRRRALNMSVLIATGVLAAYLASIVLLLAGEDDAFFEAAAMLVTFVLFGHWMEMKSRRGTTDALRALFDLVPPMANVLRNGTEVEIPSSEIVVGDMVVIRPGDKIPVDGVIEKGETTIDESLVTGESIPVDKSPGDEVVGGSINQSGSITFRATRIGADTALGQIVRLVQEAQNSKAPGQRLADTAAQYLVILAVSAGLITFAVWMVFSGEDTLTALTFAISAVVIACPDALGLATPTAVAVGTGVGARHNILIKDAATLEGVSKVDAVVLDKTGTLTEGRPVLTAVVARALGEQELLALAASAEQASEHPLARAIVEGARKRGASLTEPQGFQSIAGHGLQAQVDGRQVVIGNRGLMADRSVALDGLEERAMALADEGNTPMYVAVDGRAAGVVAVADTIRASARQAVKLLREAGSEVVMMTGDNRNTAQAVARELGIERVFAEVLPQDKAGYVKQLQTEGKFVAMVGDGINDAPALAQANVGMAIGAGTDVAIETADVVLMKSDPLDVMRAMELSKATVRKMKQNLVWASIYNILAIPVAAGVLYPSFGIELRPEWSALLMSVSSIIVAANAVLLKRIDQDLSAL